MTLAPVPAQALPAHYFSRKPALHVATRVLLC
jgi:hypothetical protein